MPTYNQADLIEYGSNIFSIDVTNPEDLAKYVIPLIQGLNTATEKAGNINLKDLLEGFGFAQYLTRAQARNEYGVGFHWYLGTQANMPERSFILNGQNLLIPSSIDDNYWYAYKEWGTKYNTEETPAGYFGTPDFMTRADGTNGPNYIGSTGDFAQVGTKLIDTIRNISGDKQQILTYSGSNADINSIGTGPFETTEAVNFLRAGEGGFWTNRISLTFNASRVVQTSEVNRPNTVLALPIYIY